MTSSPATASKLLSSSERGDGPRRRPPVAAASGGALNRTRQVFGTGGRADGKFINQMSQSAGRRSAGRVREAHGGRARGVRRAGEGLRGWSGNTGNGALVRTGEPRAWTPVGPGPVVRGPGRGAGWPRDGARMDRDVVRVGPDVDSWQSAATAEERRPGRPSHGWRTSAVPRPRRAAGRGRPALRGRDHGGGGGKREERRRAEGGQGSRTGRRRRATGPRYGPGAPTGSEYCRRSPGASSPAPSRSPSDRGSRSGRGTCRRR